MAPPSACAASPPRRASGRGPSRACCQGGRESSLGGGQGPAADLESGAPHPTARTPMSLAPPAPSARDHRDLLRTIAEGTAGTVGAAFLRSLSRCLAAAFGADVAYVAELMDANPADPRADPRVLAGRRASCPRATSTRSPTRRASRSARATSSATRRAACAASRSDGVHRPQRRSTGYLARADARRRRARLDRLRLRALAHPAGRGRGGVHRPAHLRRARRRRAGAAPPRGRAARPRGGGRRVAHAAPARRRRGAPADRARPARRRAAAARRARPVRSTSRCAPPSARRATPPS